MAAETTVRVDTTGRLIIPRDARAEMNIQPGETFVFHRDGEMLRYVRAENPFDALAEHALAEHRAGQTVPLRDFAAEQGFALGDG